MIIRHISFTFLSLVIILQSAGWLLQKSLSLSPCIKLIDPSLTIGWRLPDPALDKYSVV